MTPKQALASLARRKKANKNRKRIDNSKLYAGSPMYFYCKECGDESDVLPESFTCVPRKYCKPCQDLKDAGLIV